MENTMKKYKVIALSALIAAGFTSCDLTEKPTSYYEKDTYFETMDQAKNVSSRYLRLSGYRQALRTI